MALLPLYDVDPLEGKTTPFVTYGLIAINVIVGIVVFSLPPETYAALLHVIGLAPAIETRELPRLYQISLIKTREPTTAIQWT
jgi:hypothetical protein